MAPKDRSYSRRDRESSHSRRDHRSHRHSRYRERSRSNSRKKYEKDNLNKSKEININNSPKEDKKDENYERNRRKAKAALLVMLENEEKMKKAEIEKKNTLDMDFLKPTSTTEGTNNEIILPLDNKEEKKEDKKEDNDNMIIEEKEEEDPLDAYMKTIEKDATMQDYEIVQELNNKKENETIDPSKIVTIDDIKVEDTTMQNHDEVVASDNFYKSFLSTIEKVVPQKEEENKVADIIYQEDINEYISNPIIDNTDEQWKRLKFNSEKGKELKPVNHNEINYEPFRKDLYIEPQEISNMSDAEVALFRKEHGDIKVRGRGVPKPIFNWYHCGLNSTIIQVLEHRDIKTPFPIQMQGIPCIMSGRDVIGIAETGSGKTLAYVLPMLRHVMDQRPLKDGDGPIALILVPTRELAVQIYQEIRMFTKYLNIEVSCVYGGSAIGSQISELRRGREIVVATPGRFIEILCLSNGKITNLRRVTYVVLDEADRMLDMGFEPQIARIIANIRPSRQTVMFSATFPRQIESLAKKVLTKPLEIVIGQRGRSAKNIEQHVEIIQKDKSFIRLLELLDKYNGTCTIIFVDSQDEGIELWKQLFKKGFNPVLLHGGMDQEDRMDSIDKFKKGISNILISTSISARGLDVKQCGLVINFRCPNHLEDYIHRIGRTGRAGTKGIAYTFISPDDEDHLAEDILRALEYSEQEVPIELRELVRNYRRKLENGEADKFRISGYLGRGYQFTPQENEKSFIERKLLGTGFETNEEVDENEIKKEQERLKLLEEESGRNSKSTALTLRNPSLREKENKMKLLSRDPKAKQIALDVGITTAKAAIISGKKEDEILPLVQEAIQKALENYKPSVSVQKGLENAAKIIEEWEEKENIRNHIYSCEFEINDYPINARIKGTKKDNLKQISEVNDVDILVKGVFVEPGKKVPPGQKKLYLVIKGQNQSNVNSAFRDLKRQFDENALNYYTTSGGYTGNVQRYNI